MIELLAPSGDEKSFLTAINCGADAIYIGMSDFSARKNAQNFNGDNIAYYVSYAHALGVKVYVAVNTLVKDAELPLLLSTVELAYNANADAFILQDIFLGDLLKKTFPGIVLHLSTQAGINEESGAIFAKNLGFSRVILARETPLKEIEKIAKIIETEVFVHGALCTCFSGHCYMSAYVGGNSGNRGYCKQPCRKEYSLEGSKSSGNYPISLSDLCLADEISLLKKIGVASIKIEGRMRSPEYVASAVKLYRNVIDGKPYGLSEIKRTFNRGNYTKGYLYGVDANIISDKVQNHLGEKVGTVTQIKGDRLQTKRFNLKGDAFKIISNGFEVGNAVCSENGNVLLFKGRAKLGDELYLTKDSCLSIDNISQKTKVICVTANAIEGEYLTLSSEGVTVTSDEVLQSAKSSPITVDEIVKNLNKTDVYPYEVKANVTVKGSPFIAKSSLNKLRAKLYEKVFFKDVKHFKISDNTYDFETNYNRTYKNIILADEYVSVDSNDAFVLHPSRYSDGNKIDCILKKVTADKYIFVPSFLPSQDKQIIISLLDKFDGIYADGLSGVYLAKEYNKKLIAGLGLNVFNKIDLKNLCDISKAVVLSQELGQFEIDGKLDLGYAFRFGSIRLMELLYCPFGKSCSVCKRDGDFYNLTDKIGHKFKVRRYKIGSICRFEVYNEQILFADKRDTQFINLIGIDKSCYEEYINSNAEAIKESFSITYGNLKRGVN